MSGKTIKFITLFLAGYANSAFGGVEPCEKYTRILPSVDLLGQLLNNGLESVQNDELVTKKSPSQTKTDKAIKNLCFENRLAIKVSVSVLKANRKFYPKKIKRGVLNLAAFNPAKLTVEAQSYSASDGDIYVISSMATGGLIGVYLKGIGQQKIIIDGNNLTDPFSIGAPPEASPPVKFIPEDGISVVVGYGEYEINDGYAAIIKEQNWKKLGSSYTIAPGESKSISYTHRYGLSRSNSVTSSHSESATASASASDGFYSASISATVSSSTSTMQQSTISEETTTIMSDTLTNITPIPITYLRWGIQTTYYDVTTKELSEAVLNLNIPTLGYGTYLYGKLVVNESPSIIRMYKFTDQDFETAPEG